jgi:hypothetical protein
MAAGNTLAVKHIFSRCLLDCPNVDLWFIYIRFIKKVGISSSTMHSSSKAKVASENLGSSGGGTHQQHTAAAGLRVLQKHVKHAQY